MVAALRSLARQQTLPRAQHLDVSAKAPAIQDEEQMACVGMHSRSRMATSLDGFFPMHVRSDENNRK